MELGFCKELPGLCSEGDVMGKAWPSVGDIVARRSWLPSGRSNPDVDMGESGRELRLDGSDKLWATRSSLKTSFSWRIQSTSP